MQASNLPRNSARPPQPQGSAQIVRCCRGGVFQQRQEMTMSITIERHNEERRAELADCFNTAE
jgi:hypothetical protein